MVCDRVRLTGDAYQPLIGATWRHVSPPCTTLEASMMEATTWRSNEAENDLTAQVIARHSVIVNGRRGVIQLARLFYDDCVTIAYGENAPHDDRYTVVYQGAPGAIPDGSLRPGESVAIGDGLVVNVAVTPAAPTPDGQEGGAG